MTKRRLKPWVIISFSIICLIGVIYSSYQIIIWEKSIKENAKIKENLENKIVIVEPKPVNVESENNELEQEIEYQIDFESLKETNSDTIAYIKVNGTNIDYIVVKGKDNKYYLKNNFEKKKNTTGWIFGDYHNKFDGTDKNLVIYGHNTKDGSMFGTLKNTLEKEWYENEENHELVLVTEDCVYHYEVFSTYSIITEDYYINTIFKDNNEFDKFVKTLKSRSIYDYGVEINGLDQIITLSSCYSGGKKRVVLHAKLVKTDYRSE